MPPREKRRLDQDALWGFAVRTLSGRARSTGELRERLRARAARAEDVDAVLARLKELDYLDDRRFAESLAASRLDSGSAGRRRVFNELRTRRVASTLAEQSVAKVFEGVDETLLVEEYLRRKFRIEDRPRLLADEKQLAAAFRRLMRAGFSRSVVAQVLKRYAESAEALARMEEEPLETDESP